MAKCQGAIISSIILPYSSVVSPLKLFRLHHCTTEDKRDVRSSSVDSDEVAAAAAASEHASLGSNAAALFKMFQSRRYLLL